MMLLRVKMIIDILFINLLEKGLDQYRNMLRLMKPV